MKQFERYVKVITNVLVGVSLIILACLMFLTAADITGRLFGKAIKGAYQMSEIMQVAIICLAWPFTTANFGHIKVEFFMTRLPSWIQNKINIFTHILSVVVFGLIAWQGIVLVKRSRDLHELIGIIDIPLFPFQVVIFIGAFVNCLVLLVQLGYLFTQSKEGG